MEAVGRAGLATEGGLPTRADALGAAQMFESLFVSLLLEGMTADLGDGGFFGDAAGTQIQQGMFNTMLAEGLCTQGPGLGLADRIVEDWVRQGLVQKAPAGEPMAPRPGKETNHV